jgi:hypothetical protein
MTETSKFSNYPSTILISEPYIFNPNRGRLGEILQQADLVSEKQVMLALHEQSRGADLRIGEILALRGWIDQKTVEFFGECWREILTQKSRNLLGYYLKEAGLLNHEQISRILIEQDSLWLRFGSVAVLKGWLKQTTLDFFLGNLFPAEAVKPAHRRPREHPTISLDRTTVIAPCPEISVPADPITSLIALIDTSEEVEEIPWVD